MEISSSGEESLRAWRLAVPGVALIALCYGIARFAYGLFVPAFRETFGLSDSLLGLIGAGSYGGYCLAIVAAAFAVARQGPRTVAATAGIVATLGMAIVAVAPTPEILAIGAVVAGSSTGIASPPLAEALSRWLRPASQTRAQSIVNAGPGAGIALSGPVTLLAVGDWRLAWAAFAALGAVVTIWIVRAIPSGRRRARTLTGLSGLSVTPPTVRLAATATLFGASSACTWTFGRDHLSSAGGHSEAITIALWILLGLSGIAGAASGDIIERHGLTAVWRIGLAGLALATATLGTLPANILAAALAMTVFGLSYMTLTIVVFFSALQLTREHPAITTGLGFFMITIGQALAAPLAGLISQNAGATSAFHIFAAVTILVAATAPVPRKLRAL